MLGLECVHASLVPLLDQPTSTLFVVMGSCGEHRDQQCMEVELFQAAVDRTGTFLCL